MSGKPSDPDATISDVDAESLAAASDAQRGVTVISHPPPGTSPDATRPDATGVDRTYADGGLMASQPTMADASADDLATRKDPDPHEELELAEKIRRHLQDEEPVRVDEMIGQLVGDRYRIESKLGAGGMGAVYRARQEDLGRDVAVKVLLEELTSSETLARRFTVEALAVSRLKHPNTIQIYDFGRTEQGRLYIAMELLEGDTLHDRLQAAGRIAVRPALRILAQVAAALEEAHGKGIIHRDLKPENVFLVSVGANSDFVKVLDFGVAKLRDGVGDGKGTLTKAGSIFGTPRYMSPEQASAKPVDPRSDLYTLGVILFELLTGRPPFESEIPITLLLAHVNQPPPPMAAVAPDVAIPASVEALVQSLLAKAPGERPETAAAVREQLLALADELPDAFEAVVRAEDAADLGVQTQQAPTLQLLAAPETAPPPLTAPPAEAPARRGIPMAWIGGIAVALIALLAGGVALRSTPPAAPAEATLPKAPRGAPGVGAAQPAADAAPTVDVAPKPEAIADAGTPTGADVAPVIEADARHAPEVEKPEVEQPEEPAARRRPRRPRPSKTTGDPTKDETKPPPKKKDPGLVDDLL